MAKERQDYEMWAGDSFQLDVEVTDGNGEIEDISGYYIEWVLAERAGADPEIVKDTDGDVTITDGPNGTFIVDLFPPDTTGIYGKYHHEAQATDDTGNEITLLTGNATINRSST